LVEYKLLEPSGEPTQDVRTLAEKFAPLMDAFWAQHGKDYFGVPNWDIQPVSLTQLWMTRRLVILIAEENEKSIGFIMGVHLQPFFQQEGIFQVEAWYGVSGEVVHELFRLLKEVFKFLPEKFLYVPLYNYANPALLNLGDLPQTALHSIGVFTH
jgi:hypothetical protein